MWVKGAKRGVRPNPSPPCTGLVSFPFLSTCLVTIYAKAFDQRFVIFCFFLWLLLKSLRCASSCRFTGGVILSELHNSLRRSPGTLHWGQPHHSLAVHVSPGVDSVLEATLRLLRLVSLGVERTSDKLTATVLLLGPLLPSLWGRICWSCWSF